MRFRYLFLRIAPRLDRRWIMVLLVLVVVGVAATFVRWGRVPPPLELVALGAAGQFQDTVSIPGEWGETTTSSPDAPARFPLVLAVRNAGDRAVQPGRLSLRLPLRYRLTGAGGEELEGLVDPGSPLIAYTIEPGLGPVEPGRVPTLLPAHERLWLEVVVPRYSCVSIADSIPEFVPAPPAPLAALSELRIFYVFDGGDMSHRRTGTLTVRLDTTLLDVTMPDPAPTFPMEADPVLARPDLGQLMEVGSRAVRCGDPEAPMEMLSTVWETESGARFIALDYGGKVRKHLYDLNGDGVVDRESWDPDGDGSFTATRRARFPIPEFLLPAMPSGAYDMASIDTLSADSVARLDPFRRAMHGPGPAPGATDSPALAVRPVVPAARPGPTIDELPEPRIEPVQPRPPLGRPIPDGR